MAKIILASSSVRRARLLEQIGVEFDIFPPNVAESIDLEMDIEKSVQRISGEKAVYVAHRLRGDFLVVGADTVVFKDRVLGKPSDEKEAFDMLKFLQGKWHYVITGVTVADTSNFKVVSSFEKTGVKMRKLSDDTIKAYVKTGEPMDKAGAYGIQGIGAVLVERIEGCYFNVVGLPLAKLSKVLEKFGVCIL